MRLQTLRRRARAAFTAAALGLTLALAGCDNPACVFGGTCVPGGGGGGIGTLPASVPLDGEILKAAAPRIVRAAPSGTGADRDTPIAVVFSESMAASTLNVAFELEQVGIGALPLSAATLIGDGRLLVMFPLQPLTPGGQYNLRFRDNVQIGDRTGQELVQPASGIATSFTVASTAPTTPSVVLLYPEASETGLPATSEIAVVFSRAIQAGTVTDASFDVKVGGAPPMFDPPAQPVTISTGTSTITDTRVFRWISLDAEGNRASLGTNASVALQLSPPASRIKDNAGNDLGLVTSSFTTLAFSAPTGAAITSFPADAIGVNQLSGPADLAVRVDLADAMSGDRLGVFLFGTEPGTMPGQTIAFLREAALVAPFTSFTFTAAELDLVSSTSPLRGRLRDGTVSFAFRLKRGTLESPVRLLDVEPLTAGTQSPVLDLVAPTLIGMGTSGTAIGTFRSDARDLVLVGRASEELRAAHVDTVLGDNERTPGEIAPVVGSEASSGLFVTAPVRVGVLDDADQPLAYSLTIYDRAMNSGGTAMGTFVQEGAAARGAPRPFMNVTIDVFDAATLLPVAAAPVFVHEHLAGSVSEVASGATDLTGRVVLSPALIGDTIVTVAAAGYELFTLDGMPAEHVSIPLRASATSAATAGGFVTTTDANVNLYTRNVADTRFPRPGETLASVNTCSLNTQTSRFECAWGPVPILPRELGAATGLAVLAPPSLFLWSAPTFLRSFGLRLPLADLPAGGTQNVTVALDRLDLPTVPAERLPLDVTPHILTTADWPALSGAPRVRVEGLVPGLPGPLTVGQGVAFTDGTPPGTFTVRAAYAGIADPTEDSPSDALGELVSRGTLEPDLFLRAEVVDAAGARGVARPRLSNTGFTLAPPAAAVLASPAITANGGLVANDLTFSDVLPDAAGQPGLYRATLVDGAGRRWTVWRVDAPDADGPDVVAHLPFVGAGSTWPLAAGDVSVQVSAWSWTAFDATSFLWTDVAREAERASHSASATVAVP